MLFKIKQNFLFLSKENRSFFGFIYLHYLREACFVTGRLKSTSLMIVYCFLKKLPSQVKNSSLSSMEASKKRIWKIFVIPCSAKRLQQARQRFSRKPTTHPPLMQQNITATEFFIKCKHGKESIWILRIGV